MTYLHYYYFVSFWFWDEPGRVWGFGMIQAVLPEPITQFKQYLMLSKQISAVLGVTTSAVIQRADLMRTEESEEPLQIPEGVLDLENVVIESPYKM